MSVKTIDDLPWALVQLLSHWKNLDAKLAPGQIILTGDYGRPEMMRDLEALNALSEVINQHAERHKQLTSDLTEMRKDVKESLRSFIFSVRGLLMGTEYEKQLPRMPDLLAHEQPFIKPMQLAVTLWKKINTQAPPPGFAAPLVLANGLTQPRFEQKVKGIKQAFDARTKAVEEERKVRKEREKLASTLRDRAIQYHRVISGSFPSTSEEVRSLPRLWPPTVRRKKVEESAA